MNGISLIQRSPAYEEAMKRYEAEVVACADFEPPLTPEEKKHILDACLTGGTIMLRCSPMRPPPQ